jgi:pullulanase/glycogen debranching enzyme
MAIDITPSDCVAEAPSVPAVGPEKRSRWAQTEGTPLPLGATWIEEDQAFNFAVCAEHAESVKLFLYSPHRFGKASFDISV